MIDRVRSIEAAVRDYVRSGQTLMVGGFGRGGVPFSTIDYIAEHASDYNNFTVIKNDGNEVGLGIGLFLRNKQVRRLISTHIGLNPEYVDAKNNGTIECELVPQGIFAERIRAGGAGIPAFLTDIGLGTIVAEGKPIVALDGKEWLLERALRGDVALVCADIADRAGNAWWRGSNRNMCVVMATACDRVIVEAKEIVEIGALQPENIHLPCVFVDAVVQAGARRHIESAGAGT